MGTRQNRLTEAVLMCTNNLCFEQKYEKKINCHCHFNSREISQYFTRARHRNVWPNFKLIQALMNVIITCKYEKDPIRNDREKVATPFFKF